ncbi:hypothetical protein H5T88_03510 [bacterium]|nr:hypothetical protein [bacterium]
MIECKFCGAENEETREACWNCFAPLKGEAAAAMKARVGRITEAVPTGGAEAAPTGGAEAAPAETVGVVARRRGLSLGWLVGIVVILLVLGGGFFFYTKLFREKPQQVARDFVYAFVQGIVAQDLSSIKPYIDPVDAATLPTTKEELKEKVSSYLNSMGVNLPSQFAGKDILDVISSLKPTVQSVSAQTESSSFSEAKVRVQVSLTAGGIMLPMMTQQPLQGSVVLTLIRQGLNWRVSLSKSMPSASAPSSNMPK